MSESTTSKIKNVMKFWGEKQQLPYQSKLHEYGIEAAKDDFLMLTFQILDDSKFDPPEQVDQIKGVVKEYRKTLNKLQHFGTAGEDDTFYRRVIAWTRLINLVGNVLISNAEDENKLLLCRDMLSRGDMMIQVSTKKNRVSPMKTFAFQAMQQQTGQIQVETQSEDGTPE